VQTQLAGKVDDSQVLTNVPSGALFTDTVYTHPNSHPVAMITGLRARLDTIAELETSIGLSLGLSSGSNNYTEARFALYEDNFTTHNHWYGMALYVGPTVGMGLWGSSGSLTIDQGSGTGAIPHLFL